MVSCLLASGHTWRHEGREANLPLQANREVVQQSWSGILLPPTLFSASGSANREASAVEHHLRELKIGIFDDLDFEGEA